MKALIFGSNGQDGFYLSRLLKSNNIDVIGVNRPKSMSDTDITKFNSVEALIKKIRPDFIFHLAANSTTRHDAIFENEKIIASGTINILESCRLHVPNSKIFISGSGLQFKNNGTPISEKIPFEARDPYSCHRISSAYTARYYRTLGMQVYIGYFFNHDSPRRSTRHLAKKITDYVKMADSLKHTKLSIGNVDVVKEWTFADDIVEAVFMFVNQDEFYEAVLGSGLGYSISNFLEIAFGLEGKNWNEYVTISEGYTPEFIKLVSSPDLIFSTGWRPKTSIKELCELMLYSLDDQESN